MNYEDFVCLVRTETENTMGKEVHVEVTHVRKNNGVELDGLAISSPSSRIAPTIYLNSFFEEFRSGRSLVEIVASICELYQKSKIEEPINLGDYTEYEHVKEHLACKLINRERNRELLKSIPYMKFLNLAIVAYYRIDHEMIGSGTIMIQKSHMELWGISEEQLFYDARRNMKKILPERFVNITKILEGELPVEDVSEDQMPMYVLTNEDTCFGASCIIYDSVLQEIGEVLRDDFWIIPSSIHECIIMPMHVTMTADEIAEMVYRVNCENVSEEDYLSDNVYYYMRDLHKLMIAETRIA